MLDDYPIKTEAGRAEIKARALPLTRSARNLLLVVDGGRSGREWLGMVHGLTEDDLRTLYEHGLLASRSAVPMQAYAPAPAPAPAQAPAPIAAPIAAPVAAPAPAAVSARPGLPSLDRAALYTYLSGDGVKLLGALKRYAFALEVERADSLEDLQKLALELVEKVAAAKGPQAALEVRRALGIQ